MRGKIKNLRNVLNPDTKYNSFVVAQFINYIMKDGKKSIAERIAYQAIEDADKKLKGNDPAKLLVDTLNKVAPIVEVRSRRVGGANYQVPIEVKEPRKTALAMRWLLQAAQSQKGKPMGVRLTDEIVNVAHNAGTALKKREDVHKMAEANRAFAHFARY